MKNFKFFTSIGILLLSILFYFGFANIGSLQTLLSDRTLANYAICSPILEGLIFCTVAERITISPGEDVVLNFYIRNVGTNSIVVDTSSGLRKYNVSVTDQNGFNVQTKLEAKRLANTTLSEADRSELVNSMWVNHHSEVLEPDQFINENLLLGRTYDFSVPGRYYVEISRKTKNPKNPEGNGLIELPLHKIEIVVR